MGGHLLVGFAVVRATDVYVVMEGIRALQGDRTRLVGVLGIVYGSVGVFYVILSIFRHTKAVGLDKLWCC